MKSKLQTKSVFSDMKDNQILLIDQDEENKIKKIKDAFISGKELTSCGAAARFLTADLRKYVSLLRSRGMNIVDRWEKSRSGARYKVYWYDQVA